MNYYEKFFSQPSIRFNVNMSLLGIALTLIYFETLKMSIGLLIGIFLLVWLVLSDLSVGTATAAGALTYHFYAQWRHFMAVDTRDGVRKKREREAFTVS